MSISQQDCYVQDDVIWNLGRIDERVLNLVDEQYTYDTTAAAVDVYVLDTGIYLENVEFGGRATWGTNTADNENRDCHGHGTHVAGTIGGKLYGLAKESKLIAVKVLACDGFGTNAGVIAGVNWVAEQAAKTKRKSAANMSLGGGYSAALNAAVDEAVEQGIVFAVAAGNDDKDACNSSPASAVAALTVGATTIVQNATRQDVDSRSYFSNYGACVDIFAPGQLIKAAWIGTTTATNTISGTSMASPHVAGVVALLLAKTSLSPKEVVKHIVDLSTKDVVMLNCANAACRSSPNTFLYTGCE